MIFNSMSRIYLIIVMLGVFLATLGCTLASPFDRLIAQADAPTATTEIPRTPRSTFTATPVATDTPTSTLTPTPTPIPSDTPTPRQPTATRTPSPTVTPTETATSRPAPPRPPTAPPPPTNTPAPTWPYKVVELYSAPTESTLLSIMVAIQTSNNAFVPGLRLVGVDPNGVVTKSEPSAAGIIGYTPPSQVVKAGNTKFEPISNYVTGTWNFHLETADGKQVSDNFTINMDVDNRSWYFIRFFPS
jgi:hypothetical protein